uniref:Secreted protein n=1 Tax=Caenorhabditis tropicalis TaxID=1561998 RepID=A0A1I7SXS2_9PELO
MKVLLVTGILLICLHGVVSIALNRVKKHSISIDKNKEVDDANALRMMIASIGVANMHKVRWNDALTVPPCDKNLMAAFNAAAVELQQAVKRIGIQVGVPPTEAQEEALAKEFGEFFGTILQASARMPNSCLHPLQTEMKCSAKQLCEAGGIQSPNCICGPMTQPTKEDDFKKGAPGSACKGKVEDGLCVE